MRPRTSPRSCPARPRRFVSTFSAPGRRSKPSWRTIMDFCSMFDRLFRDFPQTPFRDRLIRTPKEAVRAAKPALLLALSVIASFAVSVGAAPQETRRDGPKPLVLEHAAVFDGRIGQFR